MTLCWVPSLVCHCIFFLQVLRVPYANHGAGLLLFFCFTLLKDGYKSTNTVHKPGWDQGSWVMASLSTHDSVSTRHTGLQCATAEGELKFGSQTQITYPMTPFPNSMTLSTSEPQLSHLWNGHNSKSTNFLWWGSPPLINCALFPPKFLSMFWSF